MTDQPMTPERLAEIEKSTLDPDLGLYGEYGGMDYAEGGDFRWADDTDELIAEVRRAQMEEESWREACRVRQVFLEGVRKERDEALARVKELERECDGYVKVIKAMSQGGPL